MSSNGTKDDNTLEVAQTEYYHPVLCEISKDIEGKYGLFKNFRVSRPYLNRKAARVPGQWHNLTQDTLDQMRRHIDDLQEVLDAENAKKRAEAKSNGTPRRPPAKKRKAANRASASR